MNERTMQIPHTYLVRPILLVLILTALLFSFPNFETIADPSFEGEVATRLWFQTDRDSMLSNQSTVNWRMDYLKGGVADFSGELTQLFYYPQTRLADQGSALTARIETPLRQDEPLRLTLDGYFSDEFGDPYPIGTFGIATKVAFDQQDFDYWVNEAIVKYGGFNYGGIFLLQRPQLQWGFGGRRRVIPDPQGKYGSGLELSVSGTKITGVDVSLLIRFGMYDYEGLPYEDILFPMDGGGGEAIDGGAGLQFIPGMQTVPGSGYYTFDPIFGQPINGFTQSKLSFDGIRLGPARFDLMAGFSDRGFEKIESEFSLEEKTELIELEGTMTYRPTSKSVTLEPRLDLEWTCIHLYSRLTPEKLTEANASITGAELTGFLIQEVELGDVELSYAQALGRDDLFRRPGTHHYQLRAGDYLFFPQFPQRLDFLVSPIEVEETYRSVLSLEGGGGFLDVAADFYWGSERTLFGLDLFSAEAEYELTEEFDLNTGLVVDPQEGIETAVLSTAYSW